jgi:hypothetical protein
LPVERVADGPGAVEVTAGGRRFELRQEAALVVRRIGTGIP